MKNSSAGGTSTQEWSAQAFSLPYLEGGNLYNLIDFSLGYGDGTNGLTGNRIQTMRIPVLICPSDPNDSARLASSGAREHYPLSYAVSRGIYEVARITGGAYPVGRVDGDGGAAFKYNGVCRDRDFTDGMSNTLAMSEVKCKTPRYQDRPDLVPDTGLNVSGAPGATEPNGHTEWVSGNTIHTGFTTVLGPNAKISANGFDWVSISGTREYNLGKGGHQSVTRAAIPSRSYHTGIVNSLLMDGAVRGFSENINLQTWQNLGQRADGNVLGEF